MTTIEERVEAGAEWLDANRPGWVDRINLETLDLGSTCNCVLGQEFKGFNTAVKRHMGDDYELAGAWAFTLQSDRGFLVDDQHFSDLTQAWRDYITARRAAA